MSHLEKRGGRYYFRRKVPTALREHYGRDELRYSLRTPDRAEAMRLAAVETVRTDSEFAALLNPAAKVFDVVVVEPKMLREYVLDPDTLDGLPTGQTIPVRMLKTQAEMLKAAAYAEGRPTAAIIRDLLDMYFAVKKHNPDTRERERFWHAYMLQEPSLSDPEKDRMQNIVEALNAKDDEAHGAAA
ncbi:MAG: DUF6538 domain-containing protein [Pseudomonadota bacterium]|jgi:hypothetical protein|uniref:DUF6538 domain-containing protein n=1 Tax=Burkholderiaceae TaxID=119060 RepID=UPI0010F835AC|nr:DUF6538 domain-containing protein [Burkholderia sp. 4M9327F10]